jgi:hypothetical protein
MVVNDKVMLSSIDEGRALSTGNLSSFVQGDNAAEGSGKRFAEGTANALDIRFLVDCRKVVT